MPMRPTDLAAEKIVLIYNRLLDARADVNGKPISNWEQQRAWFVDVLRETLEIAAKTKLVRHGSMSQTTELNDMRMIQEFSPPQDLNPETTEEADYNHQRMAPQVGITQRHQMTRSHSSQYPGMNPPPTASMSRSYLPDTHNSVDIMATLSDHSYDTTSVTSGMDANIHNQSWNYQQQNTAGIGHTFEHPFSYNPLPNYPEFDGAGSQIVQQSPYTQTWEENGIIYQQPDPEIE